MYSTYKSAIQAIKDCFLFTSTPCLSKHSLFGGNFDPLKAQLRLSTFKKFCNIKGNTPHLFCSNGNFVSSLI